MCQDFNLYALTVFVFPGRASRQPTASPRVRPVLEGMIGYEAADIGNVWWWKDGFVAK
jgi:hypothetical protein